jgi:Flp pilus assembly protein TadD
VNAPDFDSPILDPQLNDHWARALVTGDWSAPAHAEDPELRESPYGRPPGYTWFLALVYGLGDMSYLAPRLVQMLLGLGTTALAWHTGKRLLSPGAGLVAAALYTTWWGGIFWEGELNSPPLEFPAMLGCTLLLWEYRERPAMVKALGTGLLLGLFALLRPNGLLLVPCAMAWMLLAARPVTPLRRRAGHALLMVLLCAMTIAPAIYRNYRVSGELVLISAYGGVNAYVGNNAEATGHAPPEIPDLPALTGMSGWNCFNYPQLVRRLGRTLGEPKLGFSGASAYFYQRAAEYWRHQPVDALRLTCRKTLLFWGPAEISDSKVVAEARAASPLLSRLPGFPLLAGPGLLGVLLLLAGVGPAEGRRNRRMAGLLLLLLIVGYFMSVLPFFIAGRYRAPVVPLLVIGAGFLVVLLDHYRREREGWRAGLLVTATAGACWLLSTPFVPYAPDQARYHLHHGIAHWSAGRTAQAVDVFHHVLTLDTQDAQAHLYLGFIQEEAGHLEAARDAYRSAVEADPASALAHNNLGHALAQLGDSEGAKAHFAAALEIDPFNARVRINQGDLAQTLGDLNRAVSWYREAVSLEPRNLHAHHRLVWALVSAKDLPAAEVALKQAFVARPDAPGNHVVLGDLLRLGGNLDGARAAYGRALTLEPGHAQAAAGLALIDTATAPAIRDAASR